MKKIAIEFSIVSRGTEKYTNKGYMSISKVIDSKRYIINEDHNIKETNLINGCLKADSNYTIENVVFSRLQLITALVFERHKCVIDDNVLILGLGNIGIGCLMYLLDNGFKKITIYVKKENEKIRDLLKIIKCKYIIDVNVITCFNQSHKFNTYIDTTGSSLILKNIFEFSNFNNTIIILSTPREEKYLISPLMVNRKNLLIIGGHEFNGMSNEYRQNTYEKILKVNNNKEFLKKIINTYDFSQDKLNKIKNNKENFIEVFKY
jgi:threonine dehydrogenase-like Zn-dependent dehydrogenase